MFSVVVVLEYIFSNLLDSSPTGKDTWCKRSIDVMLSNEKCAGDVIIFKAFSTGLPRKKRRVDEPVQHTKCAAIGNHPAIIDMAAF